LRSEHENGQDEGRDTQYRGAFTKDERVASKKLGEIFGTAWPEKDAGKVISFPNLSQMQKWPAESSQQAVAIQ
jgi:hypothetical protein